MRANNFGFASLNKAFRRSELLHPAAGYQRHSLTLKVYFQDFTKQFACGILNVVISVLRGPSVPLSGRWGSQAMGIEGLKLGTSSTAYTLESLLTPPPEGAGHRILQLCPPPCAFRPSLI